MQDTEDELYQLKKRVSQLEARNKPEYIVLYFIFGKILGYILIATLEPILFWVFDVIQWILLIYLLSILTSGKSLATHVTASFPEEEF